MSKHVKVAKRKKYKKLKYFSVLVSNSIKTHNNMSSFKKISNTSSKNNDRSNNNNNNAIKTPFCKVCFDAKRPGYDSHFLKADGLSTGNVVCPYLLSLECKYCKKPGHTVSYCDVLAAKTQKPQETRREKSKLHQDEDGWVTKSSSSSRSGSQEGRFYIKGLPEATSTTQNAAFAHAPRILFEDEDEDDEAEAEVVVVKTPQPMGEWAAIAAKKPVPKPIRITTDMLFQGAKRAATEKLAAKTETKTWPQMILTRNWADDSDDDDE